MGVATDGLAYWKAEAGNTPLIDTTIGDLLVKRADAFPTREALIYSCYSELGPTFDVRWTYADYRAHPERDGDTQNHWTRSQAASETGSRHHKNPPCSATA